MYNAVKEGIAIGYRHFDTAAIYGNEAEIGAATVDLLTAMIHRGETGVPVNPRVTMINGVWRTR